MKKIILLCLLISISSVALCEIEYIWKHILKYEGHILVKEPTGDYSKFGIRNFILKEYNQTHNKKLNLKNLSEKEAKQVFIKQFYKKYRIEKIDGFRKQLIIIDTIYNQGTVGITLIQQSIIESDIDIPIDGVFGSLTITALNKIPEDMFISNLKNKRKKYYRTRKNFKKYGNGWLQRIENL